MYNYFLANTRNKLRPLLKWMFWIQVFNIVVLVAAWFSTRKAPSYNHYNDDGSKNDHSEYDNAYKSDPVVYNAVILSFYLFAPFWSLYFVIGTALAFIYDAYKPAERHNAKIWGWVADGCTLIMLGITVTVVCQGRAQPYGDEEYRFFRPEDANQYTDTSSVNRIWDNICGRIMAPLTTLWIFAMSTGKRSI